ncbi:stage V sporulation protein E [Clostridia bacterium]|nr:stage V sporulation protein E [Clostridia bacterium]
MEKVGRKNAAGKRYIQSDTVKVTRYREGVDRPFLILVVVLLCFGTVMIFSASYVNAQENYGGSYFFARQQLLWAISGLVAMMAIAYLFDRIFNSIYLLIQKSFIAVGFFAVVLALNYVTGLIGKVANGGQRWFKIGSFQFQPSELLKLAVVIFFAWYISFIGEKMKKARWGILIPAVIIIMVFGAMYLQSHFSGMIILGLICVFMIFIGEAPWKSLAGIGILGAGAVTAILFFTDYAKGRILVWLDPYVDPKGDGFQTIQSLIAIGSGGLLGVGLGQSRQKHLFLPEPQNDFIFSIVCEELGLIGALIIMAIFVLLIWRGFVIAFHAPDKFSSLVTMGIIIKVALQFILNIAVVTGTIPNTGISLPFFSYGGTSLLMLMAEMGIVLSISRYSLHEKN